MPRHDEPEGNGHAVQGQEVDGLGQPVDEAEEAEEGHVGKEGIDEHQGEEERRDEEENLECAAQEAVRNA